MIKVDDLRLERAATALSALQKLVDARGALSRALNAALDGRYGPEGFSSNSRFHQAVMLMFDKHIDHLARAELGKVERALFVEKETEPQDAAGASESEPVKCS